MYGYALEPSKEDMKTIEVIEKRTAALILNTYVTYKNRLKLPVTLHQDLLVLQFLDILKDRYDIDWAHRRILSFMWDRLMLNFNE